MTGEWNIFYCCYWYWSNCNTGMTTSITRSRSKLSFQIPLKRILNTQEHPLEIQGSFSAPSACSLVAKYLDVALQSLCLWKPWLWMRLVRLRLQIIWSPFQGSMVHFRRWSLLVTINSVCPWIFLSFQVWSRYTVAPHGHEEVPTLKSVFEISHLREKAKFLDMQCLFPWSCFFFPNLMCFSDRMPHFIGNFLSERMYNSALQTTHANGSNVCCRFVNVTPSYQQKGEDGNSWIVSGKFSSILP